MHSSRMCTVHSSSCLFWGGLPQCMLGYPREQTPPDQAPPQDQALPTGPGTPPQAPPSDQAPLQTRHPHCGQTDTCKNITYATSLRTVKISYILFMLLTDWTTEARKYTCRLCSLLTLFPPQIRPSKKKNSLKQGSLTVNVGTMFFF